MPELPEIEALVGFLRDHAVGHRVASAHPAAVSVLKTFDPPVTALTDRPVTAVGRHGKFIDVTVDDLHLVFHLARAGRLRWRDEMLAGVPRPGRGPLALRVRLDSGAGFELTEAGTHKRLAVHLVSDPGEVPGVANLGPDPLDPGFTVAVLAGLLHGRRTRIKGLLRDQTVIAGVGNAWSDEILHAARLSPFAVAAHLDHQSLVALHTAVVGTLGAAVERFRGVATGDIADLKRDRIRVHGRAGEPCPVCGDTVRSVHVADSSFQYCPGCQTGGRILADRRMSRLLK